MKFWIIIIWFLIIPTLWGILAQINFNRTKKIDTEDALWISNIWGYTLIYLIFDFLFFKFCI